MKASNKIFWAVTFSLASIFSYSQDYPANHTTQGWVISKDVLRFSNKELLSRKKGINIKSVNKPAYVTSKGVQSIGKSLTTEKGNVVSQGYPAWIISKEVQKIGRIN